MTPHSLIAIGLFALVVSSADARGQGWTPLDGGAAPPAAPPASPATAPAPAAGWSPLDAASPPSPAPAPPPQADRPPPQVPSPSPAAAVPPRPAAAGVRNPPPPVATPSPAAAGPALPPSLRDKLAALAGDIGRLADLLEELFGKPAPPAKTVVASRSKVPLDDLDQNFCNCSDVVPVSDEDRRFYTEFVQTIEGGVRPAVGALNSVLRVVSAGPDQLAAARSWDDLQRFRQAVDKVARNIDAALDLLTKQNPAHPKLRSILVGAVANVRRFKDDYGAFAAAVGAMDAPAAEAAVERMRQGAAAWGGLRQEAQPLQRQADAIAARMIAPSNDAKCVPISMVFCRDPNRTFSCTPGAANFAAEHCPAYCRVFPRPRSGVCSATGYVDVKWEEKPDDAKTVPAAPPPGGAPGRGNGRFR